MAKKMKTLMVLLVTVVGFSLLGFLPASAAIVYDGAWYSTDVDSNFRVNFTVDEVLREDFFLLNEGGADSLLVLKGSGAAVKADTVYFTEVENDGWYAGLDASNPTELSLGSNPYFWFAYGGQTTYSYNELDPNKVYDLLFADGSVTITANDVAPVPIPGAALLLGSGLLGLGWLRQRRS
jgi:hypothetical protein